MGNVGRDSMKEGGGRRVVAGRKIVAPSQTTEGRKRRGKRGRMCWGGVEEDA